MLENPAPILGFSDVAVEAEHGFFSGMHGVNFSLSSGELAIIHLEAGDFEMPLADAAQGLIEPARGIVEFLGNDWQRIPADETEILRSKIGRVFAGRAWLSNLNVDENVTLAQRFHTTRAYSEIVSEAAELAVQFGLAEIPAARPAKVRPIELQRAAFVRAFLGQPRLIILESPTSAANVDLLPPLLAAIRSARARGAAILWTTTNPMIFEDPALEPTFKFMMMGANMQLVGDK